MTDTIVEFQAWPKITRENPFFGTITEKVDGTNACIVIQDGAIVATQSRKRFITPDNDNFGFARWVADNYTSLRSLGDGHHYGEWAGPGIQRNPHELEEKRLFLFNTFRWNENNPNLPDCCDVVPILHHGIIEPTTIPSVLMDLMKGSRLGGKAEGVVVFYPAFQKYTKHTIDSPNGKWCK